MDGIAATGIGQVSNSGDDKYPPKPRRAFRVGVTGHRFDKLPTDEELKKVLCETLHTILEEIAGAVRTAGQAELDELSDKAELTNLYTDEPPILRAVSSLAEGTDRYFADPAISLGYELLCPMPFYQGEFENDFSGKDSVARNSAGYFRQILQDARDGAGLTVFELNGNRAHVAEAYGAAGRLVVNQSDVLVAVWNGTKAKGAGGTFDTMCEALRCYVPIICIDPLRPDRCRLLRAHTGPTAKPDDWIETSIGAGQLPRLLASIVKRELRRPKHPSESSLEASGLSSSKRGSIERALAAVLETICPRWQDSSETTLGAARYFRESKRTGHLGHVWTMFRELGNDVIFVNSSRSKPNADAQAQMGASGADESRKHSLVPDWIDTHLHKAFAKADDMADFYAGTHRGAFIVTYTLAALAVACALLPVAISPASSCVRVVEICCGAVEFVFLASILWILYLDHRHQWHERWMDYRLLAELLRELQFLVPLGGGKPLPRVPRHLEVYGNPTQTWMYWYVRAIARQIGIPTAKVTSDYMHDCLDFLGRLAGDEPGVGQHGFHIQAEKRARNIDKRLRCTANFLFGGSILVVVGRLTMAICTHEPFWSSGWARGLLILAAFFPACGAALEGINNQGDFIRIAKRSAAMASGFHRYALRISALQKAPSPQLEDVVPLSSNIADTMIAEVVDWRAVVIDPR